MNDEDLTRAAFGVLAEEPVPAPADGAATVRLWVDGELVLDEEHESRDAALTTAGDRLRAHPDATSFDVHIKVHPEEGQHVAVP